MGEPCAVPPPGTFEIVAADPRSAARAGVLHTAHGPVETPAFMPVGTQATVKCLEPRDLEATGAQIILSNTYHLIVRPGMEVIAACGGLHRFMGWNGPILTDSGGFQVFSLAGLRKVGEDGVTFQSHVDGSRLFLGPVEAMAAQRVLGSDIAMCFDECPPYPCPAQSACQAVDKTLLWAGLCAEQARAPGQLVFGIVQGGEFRDLRERCARALTAIGFDGYAVGGVSVGEPEPVLLQEVARGVDLFDCVMPTRHARNGSAFTAHGFYPVKAGACKDDTRPVEEGCGCYCCRTFSRAYVRHLLNVNEILGVRLLTLHNVHRYLETMREMRAAIQCGAFEAWRRDCTARLRAAGATTPPTTAG